MKPTGKTAISLRTSAGAVVPFTLAEAPHLEIVNDCLNVAFRSREGMILELIGIPAKAGVEARQYQAAEFRTLLLHSGFQEEAATDDAFEDSARLEIRQGKDAADAGVADIDYRGKLHAGAEKIDVQVSFTGPLPSARKFISPRGTTPK